MICLLCSWAAGATKEPVIDEAKLAADIEQIPTKISALETKQYSGTFTFNELISMRVADINEVVRDINSVNVRVEVAVKDVNLPNAKAEYIKTVLDKHTQKERMNVKLLMSDFVRELSDMSGLDPADPNYIEEVDMRLQCIAWFFEIDELREML